MSTLFAPTPSSPRIQQEQGHVYSFLRNSTAVPCTAKAVKLNLNLNASVDKVFIFACNLLQLFGRANARVLQKKLDRELNNVLAKVDTAYYNLQMGFDKPHERKQMIRDYCPPSISEQAFNKSFNRGAYQCLAFFQRILFSQTPLAFEVREVASQRESAFTTLLSILDGGAQNLSEDECRSVAKFCYNAGALMDSGKVIHFFDLVELWGIRSQKNGPAVERLKKEIGIHHWVQIETAPDKVSSKVSAEGSFQEFLIECTLHVLMKSFSITFTDATKKVLREAFTNEQTRSDIACFSDSPADLLKFKLGSDLDRKSTPLFLSLQIFHYVIRLSNIQPSYFSRLFEMIMNRDPCWSLEQINGFDERLGDSLSASTARELLPLPVIGGRSHQPNRLSVTLDQGSPEQKKETRTGDVTDSWELLEDLWTLVKPPILPYHPYQDPFCFPLLIFLLKSDKLAILKEVFSSLKSKIPAIRFSLTSIYHFCVVNPEMSLTQMNLLVQSYQIVLQKLKEKGIQIQHPERLFVDPPIVTQSSSTVEKLKKIGELCDRFFHFATEHRLPNDEGFILLLREYILHPEREFFSLLADFESFQLGPLDFASLVEVAREFPDIQKKIDDASRRQERARILQLASSYRFTPKQLFHLYAEFVYLRNRGEVFSIEAVKGFIDLLEAEHFLLRTEDRYYLYLQRPDCIIDPDRFKSVRELIVGLRGRRQDLFKHYAKDFILPKGFLAIIHLSIRQINEALNLSASIPFLSSFFPPIEFLIDSLHFSDLDAVRGVVWNDPTTASYEGMVRPVLPHSHITTYFHWDTLGLFPALFFSLTHEKKGNTLSAYIPLPIPIREITGKASIFSFICLLRSIVLKEEIRGLMPSPVSPLLSPLVSPERRKSLVDTFPNLKEMISGMKSKELGDLSEQDEGAVWDFMERLKVSYRSLFLQLLMEDFPVLCGPQLQPREMGALGYLYPDGTRVALAPQVEGVPEQERHLLLPDISESEIPRVMEHFARPDSEGVLPFQSKQEQNYPINYSVKGKEKGSKITLSIDLEGERGKVAVPFYYSKEQLVDPSLFQKQFDRQNLILKSLCYARR